MESQNQLLRKCTCALCCCMPLGFAAPVILLAAETKNREDLQPGKQIEFAFTDAEVPPTLYSMMNKAAVTACVTVRLPDDYTLTNSYPLVVYVPGNDGGPKGNLYNAQTIAGPHGWIAAT